MVRAPLRRLAVGALGLALGVLAPPAWAKCGVERWAIKTGTDVAAQHVDLDAATDTTVAEMTGWEAPHPVPADRLFPVETHVWRLRAILIAYGQEADQDYHLVLSDEQGTTMIAEIPKPSCVSTSSPLREKIIAARAAFEATFPGPYRRGFRLGRWPVEIAGIGFWDRCHGQRGRAANCVELHPVLQLRFGGP